MARPRRERVRRRQTTRDSPNPALVRPGSDDRVRGISQRLVDYITANAEGVRNHTRTGLFGSGSVDKAVDVLVSRRLKCHGMSWLKPGALGVLKLTMLRFNNEWDAHWGSRFTEAA